MTKREIQKVLKERFGIEVTLRPRKATLQRLLKDAVSKSTKEGCSGKYSFYEELKGPCSVKPKPDWSWVPILIVLGISVMALGPWL